MKTILLSTLAIAALFSTPVNAKTITFDDLTGDQVSVPDGYQGFTYNNFYYLNGTGYTNSGYANGTVSPTNVIYNAYADPATLSAQAPFSLTSADITGAWNDGLQVETVGSFGGHQIYDHVYTVNTSGPSLIMFDHAKVDSVVFSSFGGTYHDGLGGGGTHFALDNLTVGGAVPEAATWALLITGFGAIGATLRRRRLVSLIA